MDNADVRGTCRRHRHCCRLLEQGGWLAPRSLKVGEATPMALLLLPPNSLQTQNPNETSATYPPIPTIARTFHTLSLEDRHRRLLERSH